MIRTAWFVKEFNGYKGTRMTLADFFTSSEILNLKQNYLDANGRPINSVGSHASGSYGDVDEIEENADIVHLRYRRLNKVSNLIIYVFRVRNDAIPEELLVLDPLPEDHKFPGNMRDDIIPLEFEIDFDRRPVVQGPQDNRPEEEQF